LNFNIPDTKDDLPVALLMRDSHWRIVDINSACLRLLGVERDVVPGRRRSDLLTISRHDTVMERLAGDLTSKGWVRDLTMTLAFDRQPPRNVSIIATAHFNRDGALSTVVVVISDITSFVRKEADLIAEVEDITSRLAETRDKHDRIQKQTQDFVEIAESEKLAWVETQIALNRAEESEKWFRTIVTSVADGILVINKEGVI